MGVPASAVESLTTPTTSSVLEPISIESPTSLSSALETMISPAVFGAAPFDASGIPGPPVGAPNTLTFFGVSPCFTVVPENTCGVGAGDAVDLPRHGNGVVREGRRAEERPRRARRDHPVVDARVVDRVVGLDAEPVREPGEDERHREDDAGTDDRDDETPPSPLQVAQGRDQHRELPRRSCRNRTPGAPLAHMPATIAKRDAHSVTSGA